MVKTHGSATANEVCNSIIQCITFKEQGINDKIRAILGRDAAKAADSIKKEEAEKIFSIINEKIIGIQARSGAEGKLFGSVTSKDIAQKIKDTYQITINKHKINLESEIKAFGTYKFTIKLYPQIIATMAVMVTEK